MSQDRLSELAREIKNLAHLGWLNKPKDLEYIFTQIETRAGILMREAATPPVGPSKPQWEPLVNFLERHLRWQRDVLRMFTEQGRPEAMEIKGIVGGLQLAIEVAKNYELHNAAPAASPQPTPAQEPAPTLTFGNGDYSCAVCGLGMDKPCEHWKELLAKAEEAQEPAQQVICCEQCDEQITNNTYLCTNCWNRAHDPTWKNVYAPAASPQPTPAQEPSDTITLTMSLPMGSLVMDYLKSLGFKAEGRSDPASKEGM